MWNWLVTSIGYPEPITIPADDVTVVALTRDQTLTSQILEVEAAHRIFLACMNALDGQRNKFEAFGLQSKATKKGTVSYVWNEEDNARVLPTITRLQTLSKSLCEDLPKSARKARQVSEKLGPHLKQHYKFKDFVETKWPTNEAGEVVAMPETDQSPEPTIAPQKKSLRTFMAGLFRLG